MTEGFGAGDVEVLALSLAAEVARVRAADRRRAALEADAARRQIGLGELQSAVLAGIRTITEYQAALAQAGFSAGDQATLVGLLRLRVQQQAAAQRLREAREREAQTRGLSLVQFERAVKAEERTLAQFGEFLRGLKFAAEDVQTLVALLRGEIAARAAKTPATPAGG